MKKWTLQASLTAIVGMILLAACLLLTTNSLFAAQTYYGDYAARIELGRMETDPALGPEVVVDPDQAASGASYQLATQRFSTQSILVMALILLLALGCTFLATGQALRPLKNLTASARRVDDRHMDRVPLAKARGEVLALTESYNRMLDRLEESFLIQKSFAASAAHELKTPLAVIKSSLQVLEMNPHPEREDYLECMADTGESLERIIKTVDDLLSLANLEAVPLDETVELRPVLDQAVRELSSRAEEYGVMLSVSGQASPVRGNTSLLYRAVSNLIENGIKYNRAGGTVNVLLDQDEGAVSVRVKDTGSGIPAEALSHIFEPFYRADPSRSQQIPGSGLGLAVVKMIVERHGGKIDVTSQMGAGSAFHVVLKR